MDVFAGLLSLAAFSLFLSHILKRSASLMPLVTVSVCILWFTLWGSLGLLPLGGWLWYLGAAAALGFLLHKQRKQVLHLLTPGFVLFLVFSALFIVLFLITRPMLSQWDEFVVWGTAAKVVKQSGQLYTLAQSNLMARAQPPGLAVFGYMMQFFGSTFSEHKLIASYAILAVSAFAAATALWDDNRPGAVVSMFGMLSLPLLLESGGPGTASLVYLSVMADLPMAVLFGGGLCLYFGGGKKDEKLLLPFLAVAAALVNTKDMGLAFAAIALMIAGMDLLICQHKQFSFFGLTTWKACLAAFGAGVTALFATYGGWLLHMKLALGLDRTDVGSGGESLGQLEMLIKGFKALFGIQPDAAFSEILKEMLGALPARPVWILNIGLFGGGGLALFLVILMVLVYASMLCPKGQRRQIIVFTFTSILGFAAYYLFLTFTYAYVFSTLESQSLAGYARYLLPYWMAWLMAAIVLLARSACVSPAKAGKSGKAKSSAAKSEKTAARIAVRNRGAARAVSMALSILLLSVIALQGNLRANFMQPNPSLYTQRRDIQSVLQTARNEGLRKEDTVYLISQGDDAGRYYMFAYEMDAALTPLYAGPEQPQGNQSASLVRPGTEEVNYRFPVECTAEQLSAHLKENGCTHILLDWTDGYILEEFGPLFSDGLNGWDGVDSYSGGRRYYRIEWQGDTSLFVPEERGADA